MQTMGLGPRAKRAGMVILGLLVVGLLVGNWLRREPIALVEGNSPADADTRAFLERRALAAVEREPAGQQLPRERLREQVKIIAAVRLSQLKHEAAIARVTEKKEGKVTLVIPAYRAGGRYLEDYLAGKLAPEFQEAGLKRAVAKQFLSFGQAEQTIEITVDGRIDGEAAYQILHRTTVAGGLVPLSLGSRLLGSQLGYYAPFAGFLPRR